MFSVGFYFVFSLLATALHGLLVFVGLMLSVIAGSYVYESIRKLITNKLNEESLQKGVLYNKNVIVTGGSSGIGKCVAIQAAQLGANVTIIARNLEKLEQARGEIQAARRNKDSQVVECVSLDVGSSYEKVKQAFDVIERRQGPCYMLVNSAGTSICGKIEDTTPEILKQMMDLNVAGTYYCTKAVVPSMKQQKEGKIVVVSSQAALLGIFGFSAYCMSKFALRGFAESLAMELTPYSVSVTLSLPPDTDTPGFEEENKSKPLETKLISESAGLMRPEAVAEQLLKDTLERKFFSYIGFESFILTTLCSGMSPYSSFSELMIHSLLMGPFKIVSAFYLNSFQTIVSRCMKEREKHKKSE